MTTAASTPRATDAHRIAVVGNGPLAGEVVRNLALAGVQAMLHRPEDFWAGLTITDLQDCACAIAAGADPESRRRLGALCRIAGVDFVSVELEGDAVSIACHPFGSTKGSACPECSAGERDPAAARPGTPGAFAASVAGALGVAAAVQRPDGAYAGAQRLRFDRG